MRRCENCPLPSAYLRCFVSRLELNSFPTKATYLSLLVLVPSLTPFASTTKLFFSVGDNKQLFQGNISKSLLVLWTAATTLKGHFIDFFGEIYFTFVINNIYVLEKYVIYRFGENMTMLSLVNGQESSQLRSQIKMASRLLQVFCCNF